MAIEEMLLGNVAANAAVMGYSLHIRVIVVQRGILSHIVGNRALSSSYTY